VGGADASERFATPFAKQPRTRGLFQSESRFIWAGRFDQSVT